MKKILISVLTLVVVLLMATYVILFTQMGNDMLKPTLQEQLSLKTKKSITIESFSLRIDRVDLRILIEEDSYLYISGKYGIFDKSFDIDFDVKLEDIKLESIYVKSKLSLKGKTFGDIDNINFIAKGDGLKGQIDLNLKATQNSLNKSKVILRQIDIKELLSLLGQPIYAKGVFDLVVDIETLTKTSMNGKSNFKLYYTTFDTKILSKTFNISLPKDFKVRADIKTLMRDTIATSKIDILSPIANIRSKKSIFDISKNELKSDYIVQNINFSKLEPLVGVKLKGVESIRGDVRYLPNGYEVSVNSSIFGGKTVINIQNDTLKASMKNLKLDKMMYFLNQPIYTYGDLSIDISMSSIKDMTGSITKQIKNARINSKIVNRDFNQTLPKIVNYEIVTNAKIIDGISNSTTNIKSTLADIVLDETIFDINKVDFSTNYKVDIDDLSNLNTIAKQKLKGSIKLIGVAQMKDSKLYVDGKSDIFDGKLDFNLKENIFNANLSNIQISKVLYTLSYPEFFATTLNSNINYDLASSSGKVKATSNDGRFKPNELSNLLKAATGFDLTMEIYNDIALNASLDKEIIDFDIDMKSKNTNIILSKGYINWLSKKINGDLKVKIAKKEYLAKISGKTSNPKVKLDTSSVVKSEIRGKIEKQIDKRLPNDIKAPVKNLLKSFGF